MLLVFWLMSIQAVWAQSLSKEDIQETCNFKEGTISFTIPQGKIPEGATCTWTVKVKADEKENEKEVTDADGKKVSADSRMLTLNLSQDTLKIEVSYTDADNNTQNVSLDDVEPKVYGKEYNGENNTKVKFYSEEDFKGKGSKEAPYIISSDLELAKLAHDVTNGKSQTMYSGKYFQLSKDINLNKGIWMPIGTLNTTNAGFFGGTLDGDGKTISNMKIYWTTNGSAEASWGLFSRLKGKDENNYATVTNLIIENASLETQKDKLPTGTGAVKIGIVASDLVDYAEVSNIIIRNSRITDNKEKYNAANVCRIGGIIGYLNNANYRIFNLSSDTEINIHKNAWLKKPGSVTVAGAIGCATTWGTNKKNIMPTNIYIHGKKMVTNEAGGSTGSVVAFYNSSYQKTYKTQYGATFNTWFYTPEVGTNTYSEGNIKEIAKFGKEFTDINNNFINTHQLEKKTWTYSSTSKQFSFSSVHLSFKRAETDKLTVMTDAGDVSKETYDWYVTDEEGEWKQVKTAASSTYTLPRQDYDQKVYAIGGGSRTNAILVKAIHVNASLSTSGNTYTVNVTNNTEEFTNEVLGLKIQYDWYNGDKLISSGISSSITRPHDATYNDKYSCHITVTSTSGDKTFLDTWVSATTVVYLNPAKGNDNNSGYTKDKPMKTWKGAYSKLSKKGSWDENIIVLMGESSKEVTNNTTNGFNITNNNTGRNILTKENWDNAKKDSTLFRNVTITGEYGDYKDGGSIEITSLDMGLPLWGDTRFENITFKNTSTGNDAYKNIFCQYNNLEMGKGIKMEGFKNNAINYGTIDGAVTTPMQIFGGFSNDGRFYPLNDPKNIKAFEESMPHGEKGFSITIKSGFYSAICVGGRQTATGNEYNGVMGTPNLPIKCTITMDIDRAWNDQYNDKNKLKSDYDAGIILAGNHEGAMYADVDIIIKSGKVARIVNGTLGAQRPFTLTYGNKTYYVPMNTFMGRANILLDPASSEYKDKDNLKDNERVVVTELYGGSMGRGHTGDVKINNPFYGYSTITINDGTFKILPEDNTQKDKILCGIFGAGAGGMNGIGYGDDKADTHTPDQSIAYWNDKKDVMLYGPYADAKDKLVHYNCYNAKEHNHTDVDPLYTNTKIIINGGVFGSKTQKIDGIYAGGSGYMSPGLWTSSKAIPSKTGGNVYGSKDSTAVSLTINGGEFYCEKGIFAGGRGTNQYYSKDPYGAKGEKGQASDYTALGQTYGNVALNINGGTFYSPIFGGGYGVADAKLYNTTDSITTLSKMALIKGQSNVTINGGFFYQNIYGGGDMAVVENKGNDATNITIGGDADIRGSVFAGGNGRTKRLTGQTFDAAVENTKSPKSVGKVIGNTNVTFTGSTQQAPYIYGDIYGGGNLAQVEGDTKVNIYAAHFAGQIFGGGKGNITDQNGNALNKEEFTSADILGGTHVTLAQDMGGQVEGDNGKKKDNFSINVIWNKIWDPTKGENGDFIVWNPQNGENLSYFYASDKADGKKHFLNPHNIYGGGNLACNVTGSAFVEVLKGMTPFDLLNTAEWKESYNDNNYPHFSVFGGGYGEYTIVAYTEVTVNVEGDYSDYDAEVDNSTEQLARPHSISRKGSRKGTRANSETNTENKKIPVFDNSKGIPNFTILGVLGGGYAGTVTHSSKVTIDGNTFLHRVYGGGFGDPYKTTDNTTGQIGHIKEDLGSRSEVYVKGGNIYGDVFGGGAGVAPKTADGIHFENVARVNGNTMVEVSNQAKIYGKVFGGGDMANVGPKDYTPDYSIKPQSYSNINDEGDIIYDEEINPSYIVNNYRTLVNIIGGDIYGSVYGGGAGVESVKNKNGEYIDFPDMASVQKTEVHVYGRKLKLKDTKTRNIEIDRTLIIGSVYGGGDVANVGNKNNQTYDTNNKDDDTHRTTLVNIRGAGIYSQVFAGGKGRLVTQCGDVTHLGAIYGNTSLLIDRPIITYPYRTETGGYEDPSSDKNMAHPAADINKTMLPLLMEKIYGGCQNGTVYGNTFVTIYDGRIGHGIYGGGLGSCDSIIVNGQDSLAITSADVKGNTNVYIKGGQAMLTSYWLADTRSWEPASIIEGITYSPQYNHQALKFKINHNIYAGGNIACVVGKDAHLTMEKGLLHNNTQVVYGVNVEFFKTMVWKEIYNKVGSPHFCVFGGGYGEHTIIKGDTHVNIAMTGRGSKIDPSIDLKKGEEYKHFWSGYSVMDFVGGGYSGKVEGETYVTGDGGAFCRRLFGGGFYNSVKATHVDIYAMDCRDIFGGGMMGDVEKSTTVNIGTQNLSAASSESTFSNKDIFIHGNVYGGNDVSGYVNVVQKNGNFTDNEGTGTHINIYGGKIDGDVYGAGNGDYLYALDRKGNTQITVNENYPLNPNDPNSETTPLVFTVPMRENMPSHKAASDAAKMVNINSWRPMTNKVNINIKGNSDEDYVLIKGDVYGGGNSATVLKAQKANAQASEQVNDQASSQSGTQTVAQTTETVGSVDIKIGSNVNIRSVFMGCNGEALFTASEDNNFMNKFQKLNGDYYDASKELDFADSIDWENDPSNKGINTLYLPTENAQRPLIYPHLLDLYFQPVEMNIQGTLQWAENLTNCTIGSFYCGGNRGNMNIYPDKKGKVVDYEFPEGLTITSKIVGGCNNANYDYKGEVTHEGGYLLGTAHSEKPFIKLTIKNKFEPAVVEDAYQGGCVYGGCYKTGTVRGDVTIDLRSDMLAGKDLAKLEKSNEYLATNPEYSSLNIYGAGYGMESYVYGNTRIVMGDSISCKEPAMNNGKFSASGVSANFIYGGGQQGNVIGLTDVDILNGHVFRSVTGGSYSGYVYGSTQVKVGYPTYYQVNPLKNGKYILKRTDQKNLDLKNDDGTTETPTIKQEIYLLTSELISQGVYDDIVAIDNGTRIDITESNKGEYFTPVAAKEPTMDWENVHINIDEAIYGGGYSLAQGTSVLANNTTVLKLTKDFNVDKAFTNSAEHLEELKSLPGGTTAGFGGNTLILIGDSKTSEHITISKQDMKEINLPNGTDLYGYYYRYYDDNSKDDEYTYRFIYEMVKYYKGNEVPDLEGIRENTFYEYDSEGGIFGDGHLSYAQGFRSADITGYGFAGHTIDNPKIINTLQRMDLLRLEDNCFSLLGARDYTVNEINKTPYSIARVGEIKMVAGDGIELNGDNLQVRDTESKKYGSHARNFMGLVNNIHYVGAVKSSVNFSDTWYGQEGNISKDNKSYQEVKQAYIDNYKTDQQKFQERNNGTAKNMIGIASGYALKIQNAQEVTDSTTKKMKEKIYYGPIYGVIEINLVYARKNEGGGYVYADNIHENKDFLETTGNFVFPLNESSERYIVDDCSPIGFNAMEGKDPDTTADIHYWYVTGLDYYYNAHITGYTYKEPISFNNDNSDGLTALAGLKAGQTVTIKSWKMRSGHLENYSCDLENNASNKYTLYVGASDEHTYNPSKGFAAKLPMSGTTAEGTYDDKNYIRKELQTGNAKIAFMLADSIDNTQADYYKDHLSKKCQATLVLEADALNDKNQVRTDTNGNPIKYTYTIYLTIEYVQGPTFTGHITIDNCALPGEMIRLKKDQVKIAADQAFAANGYFWHIGKLKRDKDGKLKKDEKGDMQFDEETSWLLKTNSSENTYKQGDKIDDSRKDLFAGSIYDKTRDYLDIPAYYFMNGHGVQLGVTMNGFDNVVFPVNMAANDTLVVHNYHQMDPHKTGVNLHLPEAIQRAKNEAYFAEPRIYINDASDLKAFGKFILEESNDGGADAQFVLQNDLVLPADYTGNNGIFKGIFHGNGYVIQGLDKDKWLFKENQGNIYNLGLESGNITQKGMNDANATKGYHCCFEKEPVSNSPIVYDMNGKKMTYTIEGVVKNYTTDDFKYGRVAYDLNGYYLRALQGNTSPEDKKALKYIYDYYANGDYQYAHRSDAITGNNTGITYLRTSADSDLPNYGQTETRHDKTHKVDEARAIYTEATAEKPATFTGTYRPLLNEKDMNDFLFWGQSLQSTPADYPAKIASQQNKYMINRVYRTDGYYGSTKGKFYYNAYNQDGGKMGTYVHLPATTAINFAASDDNATSFYDFIIKDGVTRNLLVYTEGNKEDNATDAYDIVSKALSYDENTAESLIMGHHIVKSGEAYATQNLHLVERTPDGKNSEGDACDNNDFCVPIQFSVTNHAWYVRKPLYYAENTTGAWEGICLPFTVQKAEASINGEITHFYGTEDLHHEYWLRGLTDVKAANTVNAANATEKTATFQRPGAAEDLFHVANAETQEYKFHNTFFVDTYKAWSYNEEKNSYYNEQHTYSGYLPLTAGIPYVVRFPGVRYYEFDLSSKFYNSLLNKKAAAQTITFHAYGEASDKASRKAIEIPITQNMGTENISGFSHRGTFTAQQVGNGILGMNDNGSAFVSASGSVLASTSGSALSHTTVMPFRTYMVPASQQARVRSTDETKVIRISETTGIDRIEPEANGNDEDTPAGEYLLIRPIGAHRVSIESTYATQLKVFSTTGQLHRILDVQPGTATYSGFPDGIYIFGKSKIMVK